MTSARIASGRVFSFSSNSFCFHGLATLVDGLVMFLDLFLLGFADGGEVTELRPDPLGRVVGGGEKREEAVMVALGDGIELVGMATGAADGEAERAAGYLLNQLEESFVSLHGQVAEVLLSDVEDGAEVAGGGEELVDFGSARFGVAPINGFVARELFGEKTVPGLVGVESLDHVVTIAPQAFGVFGFLGVKVFAGGIDITRGVEPLAAPTLTITGRGQQAIQELLVGLRRLVFDKIVELGRGGWESG